MGKKCYNMKLMLEAKIEKIFKYISGSPVQLVAVTKTIDAGRVARAIDAGVKDIAESRVQEATAKFAELGTKLTGVRTHCIGHLQTNKAKKAVALFGMIQSVDSLALAAVIDAAAAQTGKLQECLLEVKVSSEPSKHGIDPADVASVYAGVIGMRHITVRGLMAMAPYFDDAERARPYFKQARSIFESTARTFQNPNFSILSMGMSHDYRIAVEEGATMIRIGSALFNEN